MKRLAIILCALLVAAVAAINIAVYLLDARSLAASLAASVKADTGRELGFGEVGIELLPRPALVVSAVRFGNAAWGSQPWLAQVGRVRAGLDLPALLAGRLRFRQVAISGANLLLETDPDGKGNWVVPQTNAAPPWLKGIEIDELMLQAVTLNYRNGITGKVTSVQLDSARIELPLASQPIRLSTRATVAGQRMEVAGTIGPLAALLANAPAYPVDLECRYGEASVNLNGSIDKPLGSGDLNLALRAHAPEFDGLAALFGAAAPPLGAFRGTARLTGTMAAPGLSAIDIAIGGSGTPGITLRGTVASLRAASGIDLALAVATTEWWRPAAAAGVHLPPFRASARLRDAPRGYRLDDLEARVADSSVTASLQVVRDGPRLRVTGKLASPLIDLARRAPGSGAAAASAAGPSRRADFWKLADVDLDLNIGRLVLPDGRQLQSGSGQLALSGGRLSASALQVTLGGAKVKLDGSVADPQNLAGLDLGVAVQGGELAELLKFFGVAVPPLGAYHGSARLSGSRAALSATAIDATAGRPGQNLHVSGEIGDAFNRRGMRLAITANVSDSAAAGRLFGADLPHLPALRATARLGGAQDGYVFDDLKLALGRTSVQGRIAFVPGEPRPRLTVKLGGPLVDFSELPSAPARPGATNPLLAVDVDADLRFERVVLANRRALGPVSGGVRLAAGVVGLKQFTVAVDGASATLDGSIGDPMKAAALDLMVNARLTRGAGLAALTGMRLQGLPAFTAGGRLTDMPDGYALAGLTLAGAATTISGDLAVTRGAKRFKVSAKGSSPLLDLSAFMAPAAADRPTKTAVAGARAIPDVALPLDVLRSIDGEVELRFDTVKFGDAAPLGPLRLHAGIAGGRLEAGPVQLDILAGQMLSASGTVDAGSAAWSLRMDTAGLDLGQLLARLGRPGLLTGGSTDLALQLQGRGKSLPALLGSLNGDVQLKIGPAIGHGFVANIGNGIFARTVGLINPFHKTDPDTNLKCLGARVPVRNGVITSGRNVAVETAKYNAVLNGTVDLRTELIDLAVMPVVKGGRGIGSGETISIVRLRGTLAAPVVGIDAAGAAKSAASLGAAVATLGAWWLADAMIKQVISDPNPCATALAAGP